MGEELEPQLADSDIARMIDLSIERAMTSSAMVHEEQLHSPAPRLDPLQ